MQRWSINFWMICWRRRRVSKNWKRCMKNWNSDLLAILTKVLKLKLRKCNARTISYINRWSRSRTSPLWRCPSSLCRSRLSQRRYATSSSKRASTNKSCKFCARLGQLHPKADPTMCSSTNRKCGPIKSDVLMNAALSSAKTPTTWP